MTPSLCSVEGGRNRESRRKPGSVNSRVSSAGLRRAGGTQHSTPSKVAMLNAVGLDCVSSDHTQLSVSDESPDNLLGTSTPTPSPPAGTGFIPLFDRAEAPALDAAHNGIG